MKLGPGAKVAITGGTGSFGSTMARHLLRQDVDQVRIFSRDEAKQDEMRRELADDRMRFFLGDVRDYQSVLPALADIDFVFHAAALKQVPSAEFFPGQAVLTNVLGSENVIRAAAVSGVDSVVCLSTDKAVYPVNAMGMTKGLMEKTAQAFARNNPHLKTRVAVTRYGNVMCSRGSVIPMFVQQLRANRSMTVTDGGMTRFLMSLDQSVDLVLHAFHHGRSGDLFVRKAPACTIQTLATAVAELMDVADFELKVIGTRHGEKRHETLLSREELLRSEDQTEFFRVPLDARSLQYELFFDAGMTEEASLADYTSENAERLDVEQTKRILKAVPEFQRLLERA